MAEQFDTMFDEEQGTIFGNDNFKRGPDHRFQWISKDVDRSFPSVPVIEAIGTKYESLPQNDPLIKVIFFLEILDWIRLLSNLSWFF